MSADPDIYDNYRERLIKKEPQFKAILVSFNSGNPTEKTICSGRHYQNLGAFFSAFYNTKADRKFLMQYTGLHDKEGNRIFEGDILRHESGHLFIAEWEVYDDNSGSQVSIKYLGRDGDDERTENLYKLTKIVNICQVAAYDD